MSDRDPSGLVLFVVVTLANVLGLLVDGWLSYRGQATISDHVRQHPILGVPIVLWQLVGAAGLCWHFWGWR